MTRTWPHQNSSTSGQRLHQYFSCLSRIRTEYPSVTSLVLFFFVIDRFHLLMNRIIKNLYSIIIKQKIRIAHLFALLFITIFCWVVRGWRKGVSGRCFSQPLVSWSAIASTRMIWLSWQPTSSSNSTQLQASSALCFEWTSFYSGRYLFLPAESV